MARPPKISIVMPVHNAAGTLRRALQSIQSQTLEDWELVAVEDGSDDETAHFLTAESRADPRVRLLVQEHGGIVQALQRGCAAARGDWIARMDADDWMDPERLRCQLKFLEGHPHIGVVSSRVRYGGDPTTQAGYAAHVDWINSLVTPAHMALRRFVESPVAHPSVMFSRNLLKQHGGYRSGDFPEDYELWLRWMDAGIQFGKVNADLLVWNDLPNRLSRIEARYRPEAFYQTKCVYLARWLTRHIRPSRAIWLWGAGRVTRKRFAALQQEGIVIPGFIDVDKKKWGQLRDGRPVLGPDQLPPREHAFILAAVASRGARELIAESLDRAGRIEGEDYLLVA
jgi:glycosyltransferase involved in cell wall biosynthesis